MNENLERIQRDLISEIGLPKTLAQVFLLVTISGKMSAEQISKQLSIGVEPALESAKHLVELGAFIDISNKFEAMHPRFTAVNMYRRMCEKRGIKFGKNTAVDNIGTALESVYDYARTK